MLFAYKYDPVSSDSLHTLKWKMGLGKYFDFLICTERILVFASFPGSRHFIKGFVCIVLNSIQGKRCLCKTFQH